MSKRWCAKCGGYVFLDDEQVVLVRNGAAWLYHARCFAEEAQRTGLDRVDAVIEAERVVRNANGA